MMARDATTFASLAALQWGIVPLQRGIFPKADRHHRQSDHPAKIRTLAELHNPFLIMNMDESHAHEFHLG
jgi:hypothetical protein